MTSVATVAILLSGFTPAAMLFGTSARWLYEKGRRDGRREEELREVIRRLDAKVP